MNKRKIIQKIRLRTWISIGIILILMPITILSLVKAMFAIGAPPVANTRWTLNDAQGATAQDYSSNDNDGTITGATWTEKTRCLEETCLFFDGTDDRVSRADDVDMDFASTDSFTISFWFRHAPKTSGTDVIVNKLEAVGTDGGYQIQMESDGDITCQIEDDDADTTIDDSATSTAATYDDNKWHNVACVKNSTTSLTLYIDGVLVAQDASLNGNSTLANDETFYFGAYDGGTTNEFTGYLDEFKMYRQALTASEILVDVNFGGATRFSDQKSDFLTEGLIGYWPMDEASANTCTGGSNDNCDKSGNSNDGAWNGNATVGAGKFGNGSTFDGTGDYTNIGNIALYKTDNKSISFWAKPAATVNSTIPIFSSGAGNWYVGYGVSSQMLISYTDSSAAQVTHYSGSPHVTASQWHMYSYTFEVYGNSVTTTEYLDGNVVSSNQTTNGYSGAYGTAFVIGAFNSASLYYNGNLDEMRIYNRALSPSDIKALYNWSPGPDGYWKLDERTGTSMYDASGNGNNGSTTSGGTWVNGKYGSAWNMNETDTSTVNIGDVALFELSDTNDMTISAWINPSTFSGADHTIFSKCGDASSYWELKVLVNTGTLQLTIHDGANSYVLNGTSPSTSTWTHVAAVWDQDSAANTKLFINGQNIGATPTGTIGNVGAVGVTSDPLRIGGCYVYGPFNGAIDDVRFYKYARTDQQVLEDMNGGHPTGGSPIGSQQIYWKFDEGYGTTGYNNVDANTDGTLTNIASPATSTSGWTANGKINKGIIFDGSNDQVTIATASDSLVDFNGSEKFSSCAWVYPTTAPGSSEGDLIIGKWDATTPTRGYRLYLTNDDADTTGNFRAEIYDESADQTISAAGSNDSVSMNSWYHACSTFNGGQTGAASDLKLYVNGYLVASSAANASFLGLEDVTADFTVGDYDATDAAAADTGFTGTIDELEVYADELTADQIKVIMTANSNAAFSTMSGSTTEEADVAGSAGNPPVAWYNLDQNTGTSATDQSGNGFNLNNFTGTVSWTPGIHGTSLVFGGNDSDAHKAYYTETGSTSLDLSGSYTQTAWVRYDLAIGSQDANGILFGKDESGVSSTYNYLIDANDTSLIACTFYDNGGSPSWRKVLSTGFTPTVGRWFHIACVFDTSANTLTMYINGAFQNQTTGITTDPNTGDGELQIGGDGAANADFEFIGAVDEAKIYNYARTPAQISYDYSRGRPTAWYKMEDCTGSTVNDLSISADLGSANDGTWSGAGGTNTSSGTCSAVDTATAWYNGRNGKFNSSLDFDGGDDVVTVSNSNAIDLNLGFFNGLTWSAWVYPNSDGESDTGIIFSKGTNTYCDTKSESGGYVTIECRIDLTTDAAYTASTTIPINQWSHVAMSWTNDSDDELTIWVNGVAHTSSATFSGDNAADANSFLIGNNAGGTQTFDGQIDDVRLYPYELTAAQIKKVMNEGSAARFGPNSGQP